MSRAHAVAELQRAASVGSGRWFITLALGAFAVGLIGFDLVAWAQVLS